MPDSVNSAKIAGLDKIERAFEIRDELRDVLEKLLLAEKKYTRNDNISETSARTVWAEWTLDEVPDYTRCALLMGDVIHNLRAAMDHAVWVITPERIQLSSPRDVAFPLHTTEQAFEKWLRNRRRWYGPTVVETIRSQQPFHAGGDHDGLLLIGQIDPHDRVTRWHQLPQPGQPGVATLVTTRQTTTLNHNVLLIVLGHQALKRHQEDVFLINTHRHSPLTTPTTGTAKAGAAKWFWNLSMAVMSCPMDPSPASQGHRQGLRNAAVA